jgi:muramidase (phage lysozyme)
MLKTSPARFFLAVSGIVGAGVHASAQDLWGTSPDAFSHDGGVAGLYEKIDDPQELLETPPVIVEENREALTGTLSPLRIYTYSATLAETEDLDGAVAFDDLPTSFLEGSPEAKVFEFIRGIEAGKKSYDAVWNGNRVPLPKRPTQMNVCEIMEWQSRAGKVQKSTAIGAYQFVGRTFREVVSILDFGCDVIFDQETQDRMALARLYQRGWAQFKSGQMNVVDFGYELAGEWAALPATKGKDKGLSRHHRIAGNRHLVELPEYLAFLNELKESFEEDQSDIEVVQFNAGQDSNAGLEQPVILGSRDVGSVVVFKTASSAPTIRVLSE